MATSPEEYLVGFQHVALLVSDVERSMQWYRDVLGWNELFANPMPSDLGNLNGFTGKGGDIAMGEIGGVRVELVQMHTDEPLLPWERNVHHGLFLLSVRVSDLDAVRAHCASLGVEIVREGKIGQTVTVFVLDPDGQEIALTGAYG